jgi:cysteinyl-tRNA synthetase
MGFDIHGGGQDLIFPHHENEIAQSEAYSGQEPFVRYWVHNGFVNIREEKMSKSLGNIVLVREILERYPPDAVRLLALQTHYRNPIDFGPEALDEARRALERIENCLFALDEFLNRPRDTKVAPVRTEREVALSDSFFDYERRFEEAMDDDFNSARALGVIFDLVKELNTYLEEQERFTSPAGPIIINHGRDVLVKLCEVLGLLSSARGGKEAAERDLEAARAGSGGAPSPETLIELLLEVRAQARERKEWATADLIRDRLAELGVRVDDLREGVRWKYMDTTREG